MSDDKYMFGFGMAPVRKEGESTWDKELWGEPEPHVPPKYNTTWLETRVPIELEDECYKVLNDFLISKGIDLEEL